MLYFCKLATCLLILMQFMLLKPCSKEKCGCKSSSSSASGCGEELISYVGAGDSAYAGTAYDSVNYNVPESKSKKYDSPSADPISVSLAVQAVKSIDVPEAKLAYGFVQKPVDGLEKVHFSDVPEENLYKLKSEVITLKKRPPHSARAEPEAEYLDEIEQDGASLADDNDDDGVPKVTYKQLGYAAEQFQNPKFRKIHHRTHSVASGRRHSSYAVDIAADDDIDDDDDTEYNYGGKKSNCGYKPGRIIPYKSSRRSHDYIHAY